MDPVSTANSFIITFPMVMSGFATLAVAGFWFWVKNSNSRDEVDRLEKKETLEKKDGEAKAAFQKIDLEIKEERNKREALEEKYNALQLEIAQLVRREEMERLYTGIEQMKKETNDAIAALSTTVISALGNLINRKPDQQRG